MTDNHALTIYSSPGGRVYIVKKDGRRQYFSTLFEATEGLCAEYPA